MMTKCRKQFGISLIEMVVVIAVVGILAAIATPAMKGIYNSMVNQSSVKSMIQAALSNARSIALSRQTYAGVRFQRDLKGSQYMIFVIHDSEIGASFFKAVEGKKPLKLPENFRVTDLRRRSDYGSDESNERTLGSYNLVQDDLADEGSNLIDSSYGKLDGVNKYLFDSNTFTIVFSPSGKVVVREARMRNREGIREPVDVDESRDDTFNSIVNIFEHGVGMFIQDDYSEYGLGNEYSRRSFVIYNQNKFKQMDEVGKYDYLFHQLEPVYVNAYSGELIKNK